MAQKLKGTTVHFFIIDREQNAIIVSKIKSLLNLSTENHKTVDIKFKNHSIQIHVF